MQLLKKGTKSIPLSEALEIRYSVHISHSETMYKNFNGYYYDARFYIYSTELKEAIGKEGRIRFTPLKHSVRYGKKPKVMPLTDSQKTSGILNLLKRNKKIPLKHQKKKIKNTKEITLNTNELLIYWLTKYENIFKLISSERDDEIKIEETFKTFSRILPHIGSFNLSKLIEANTEEEKEKFSREITNHIKEALGKSQEEKTTGTHKATLLVRAIIAYYLHDHDMDPSAFDSYLLLYSTPRKSVKAKIGDGMRSTALTLADYQNIYKKLIKDPNDTNCALMLIIFLNLDVNEVCGLNVGDVQPIKGYSGCYNLQVTKVCVRKGMKFISVKTSDDKRYRYVPIPYHIYNCIKNLTSFKSASNPENPLFTRRNKRINPKYLKAEFEKCLDIKPNIITITLYGKEVDVDLSFLPSSNSRSCRYYWKNHCGLIDGEIRYLSGRSPTDTISNNYIDFNNATVQCRMLVQLEYGIAMALDDTNNYDLHTSPVTIEKNVYKGHLNTTVGVEISLKDTASIFLKSNRGLVITKGLDYEKKS